jgi:hypothetical protein
MAHTKPFYGRLKTPNRELLDELAKEYGVGSAAAALNRLLDRMRAERNQDANAISLSSSTSH